MKTTVKEASNKPFTPIEISIILETKEDLLDLWHRLNTPFPDSYKAKWDPNSSKKLTEVWIHINQFRIDRDISVRN